jgi:hypothetical protein
VVRALTLWRPWPWAILFGGKRIENRPWVPPRTIIGERIALHAGKTFDEHGSEYILSVCPAPRDKPERYRYEGIVGTAVVDQWFRYEEGAPWLFTAKYAAGVDDSQERWCFGPVCWVLRDVRALPEPIACKGAMGLWVVPDDVLQAMQVQP